MFERVFESMYLVCACVFVILRAIYVQTATKADAGIILFMKRADEGTNY